MQKILPLLAFPLALASCVPEHGGGGAPPAPPQARFAPTGADAPLLPFLQALDTIGTPGAPPVAILQIGDSHTANDSFSSALRDRLQARFGNGGRGTLQPGIPFNWYRPEAVAVSASGFTAISSFKSSAGPFGIAAVRQHAAGPANATLSMTDGTAIAHAEIEVFAQPGGGTLRIAAPPDAPRIVQTAAAIPSAFWVDVPLPAPASTISIQADGNGPVDWLAWSVTRGGGITLSNLGTPGATIGIMDQWDPSIVAGELAHLRPALIIIAFGTNEGFKPSLDPAAYEAAFEQRLAFLRRAAPQAAIAVFGAPDGEHLHRPGLAEAAFCDRRWAIPANLPTVRALERQAAARANAYYWDWQAAMGGECSMTRLVAAVPPLGFPDHVHMRTPGYAMTANQFADILIHAYDRYRGAPAGS